MAAMRTMHHFAAVARRSAFLRIVDLNYGLRIFGPSALDPVRQPFYDANSPKVDRFLRATNGYLRSVLVRAVFPFMPRHPSFPQALQK